MPAGIFEREHADPDPPFPAPDMSIKSDRWIRRMAQEHGMIEPFVEGPVRQTDAQGRKVISYGVSSYGYEIGRASCRERG